MTVKPTLLITRPEPQAQQLASTLQAAGFHSICQPLFDYQSKDSVAMLAQLFKHSQPSWFIFISKAAVEFAQQLMPISQWPTKHIIAVGNTTKAALQQVGINRVLTPERFDSEGILALPELKNIDGEQVVIVRGDGGRELLAEQLNAQGANVSYFESYQRRWLTLPSTISDQWLANQVTAIIITSNALLESVVQLTDNGNKFWQNTCLWLVSSERIAARARQLGLQQVVCTYGADDQAILRTLEQLERTHDR